MLTSIEGDEGSLIQNNVQDTLVQLLKLKPMHSYFKSRIEIGGEGIAALSNLQNDLNRLSEPRLQHPNLLV